MSVCEPHGLRWAGRVVGLPHPRNLNSITTAQSLLRCKVTYSQGPGISMWTSLGAMILSNAFLPQSSASASLKRDKLGLLCGILLLGVIHLHVPPSGIVWRCEKPQGCGGWDVSPAPCPPRDWTPSVQGQSPTTACSQGREGRLVVIRGSLSSGPQSRP